MGFMIAIALICGIWAIVASLMIARDLEKRGIPVSYLWLRLMILKYLHVYSKVTREQNGRVGPLFYHYVVPLNVALVLAVVMAIAAAR
ncbi:MAG: hypothetical protein JXB46_05625 [Candidatus Eisenbacteria bacterium]|nr:hypothetical protein [Candidatus Eisenbacteria bacterium]